MKRILSQFTIHLVNYIAAIGIGLLTAFIVPLIFNMIVSEPTPMRDYIVNGVSLTVGILAWLFFASKKMGYEERELRLAEELPAVGAVFALQAVLASPMGFAPYVSGPVYSIADAIRFGNQDPELLENADVPASLCFGLLVAFDLLCIAAIFIGERMGVVKRQKDRAKTLRDSVKQDIPEVPIYQNDQRTFADSDPFRNWRNANLSNAARRLEAEEKEAAKEETAPSAEAETPRPSSVPLKVASMRPSEIVARGRYARSPRPQIPPECADLRKMVNWRLIPARVVAILCGIAFVAMEGYALWRFHDTPSRMIGATILFGLLCMAPAVPFKVGERLSDRSFEGEVLEMEFKTKTKIGLDRRAHRYTVAKLKIREDGDREFSYEYLVKGTTPFGVGSRIRHYACTDFMYLLDENAPIVCVNCGNHYSAKPEIHSDADALYGFDHLEPGAHIPDRCGYCGKSMIKRPPKKDEEE